MIETKVFDSSLFEGNILSERKNLLAELKNNKVLSLVRYSWDPPEEVELDIRDRFNSPASLVFRRTAGSLLITLNSGLILGFGYSPSQASVTVWVEQIKDIQIPKSLSTVHDDELFPINALDAKYCEDLICNLIQQEIVSAKILKRNNPRWSREVPGEVGLVLEFENKIEIILALNLCESLDDFSIIFRDEVSPEVLDQLQEISVLT
jgi:hypothetical protein